jgi:hypothetical protein
MTAEPLTLLVRPGRFAVCRLGAHDPLPAWALSAEFVSVTRTPEELSVVCPQERVPAGVYCDRGWACLRVAGTLPLTAVGVLAALTAPLAAAGVSVFPVATFDTDYLLVRADDLGRAVGAWRRQGLAVREAE